MSSLVGLLDLDGAPVAPDTLAAMLARLSHRVTPDGARRASVRVAGPVGLGCAVLPTTPQLRRELEQPDPNQTLLTGGGQLWIVSDARLDNRAELAGALGVAKEARAWSDGRLILEAYARWGEDSPRRLRGDFAYAIWDGRQKRLFCARDHFGVKPFYYAHLPGRFAFASEVKALWCVPGLDAGLNPTQIAGYLAGRIPDKTSTFYRDAHRLAPASWMSVALDEKAENARPQLYWELDGQSELLIEDAQGAARDERYAERVRDAFAHALAERMNCDGKMAVFLSGGLDSSSIAALAERQLPAQGKPLTTFSTIFDRFPQVDERLYIDQTLARGEFAPLWMNGDAISPLEELERITWFLDGPASGPNTCSAWAQYRLLQDAGVSVILDGHGGDEIVFKAYERIGELLRQGQFLAAWREMAPLRGHDVLESTPTSQLWSALLWHARDKRGLGRLTLPLRRSYARRLRAANSTSQLEASSQSVIAPACLELLPPEPATTDYGVRARHVEAIEGTLQPLALEAIDAISGAHAIETRCPFWETQLAQLCVSLPADQKLRGGHNRYVMRRAMQDILAPPVQWRRNKTDFAPQVTTLMRESEGPRLTQFFEQWENALTHIEGADLHDFVNFEALRAQWQALQDAPLGSREAALPTIVLWKVFNLGTWLAAQPPRPTAPPPAPSPASAFAGRKPSV